MKKIFFLGRLAILMAAVVFGSYFCQEEEIIKDEGGGRCLSS